MQRIRDTANAIVTNAPDIVLTIDAPGFATNVIKHVKKIPAGRKLIARGMRFHHFVAPQVWAWHPKRAKKYAATFDKLYAFFDFEVPYFTKYGLDTIAVGHPIGDDLIGKYDTHKKTSEKIITIIPGSRLSEVRRILPLMHKTIEMLGRCGYNGYRFVIPTVETTDAYIRAQVATWKNKPDIIPAANRYDIYAKTYIAIAASGTVSAELAMMHIPAIIVYKMNCITTWIVSKIINVKWVSLVNILTNYGVYPEFLGPNARVDKIIEQFGQLTIPSVRNKMINRLQNADKLWQPNPNGAIATVVNDIQKTIK